MIIAAHFLAGVVAEAIGYGNVIRSGTWGFDLFYNFAKGGLLGTVYVLIWHRLKVHRESERRLGLLDGWPRVFERFRAAHLTVPGIGGVVLVIAGVAVSTAIHDGWKGTITGYEWDPLLFAADRVLHGGMDPWRLLHPVLGRPWVTRALDMLYWWWYVLLLIGVVWTAWSTDRRLRRQTLIAYALTWVVLGTVVAHLTASVGPCFLSRHLGHATPFDALTSYLRAVNSETPLVAIYLQDSLWWAHTTGQRDYWMSISAMPSLHIAVPAIFAMSGWRTHRLLGAAIWAYTALMLIASVHLGWHYAVDGYVAILGAIAAWQVAGRLVPKAQS